MNNTEDISIRNWFSSEYVTSAISYPLIQLEFVPVEISVLTVNTASETASASTSKRSIICSVFNKKNDERREKIFDVLYPETFYSNNEQIKKVRTSIVENIIETYPELKEVVKDKKEGTFILFSREVCIDYIIPHFISIPFNYPEASTTSTNNVEGHLLCPEEIPEKFIFNNRDKVYPIIHIPGTDTSIDTIITEIDNNTKQPNFNLHSYPTIAFFSPRGVLYIPNLLLPPATPAYSDIDTYNSTINAYPIVNLTKSYFLCNTFPSIKTLKEEYRKIDVSNISTMTEIELNTPSSSSSNPPVFNTCTLTMMIEFNTSNYSLTQEDLDKFVNVNFMVKDNNENYVGTVQYDGSKFNTVKICYDYYAGGFNSVTNKPEPLLYPRTIIEENKIYHLLLTVFLRKKEYDGIVTIVVDNDTYNPNIFLPLSDYVTSITTLFIEQNPDGNALYTANRRLFWKTIRQKRSVNVLIRNTTGDYGLGYISSVISGLNETGEAIIKGLLDKKIGLSKIGLLFKKFFFTKEKK